jgi:hypothetical protein
VSASLYWRPYVPEPDGDPIGYDLKWALCKRFWPHQDGSTNTEWAILSGRDRQWLEGVCDGGGQGADDAVDLLDLIDKHGEVEIRVWNG